MPVTDVQETCTRTYTRNFEQTIVNKAVDQWSKETFVKAKGQHFEHSLFMISCIVWTDEIF